jgi:hypothetical protein
MFGKPHLGLASAFGLGLVALTALAPASSFAAPGQQVQFDLSPNPPFAACAAADPSRPPVAHVLVQQGSQADGLRIDANGLKPDSQFTVFTTQRTNLQTDGSIDPAFSKSFGLAWYQADLFTDDNGDGQVTIQTIVVDRGFGFDPDAQLAPTNTFHIGLWFNNPNDATPCGFNASQPTPFNSLRKAGPTAMISVPNADGQLGPLCFVPNGSGGCKPQ